MERFYYDENEGTLELEIYDRIKPEVIAKTDDRVIAGKICDLLNKDAQVKP